MPLTESFAFKRKLVPIVAVSVAAALSYLPHASANAIRHYSANLDNSMWYLAENSRLECGLEHTIPRYGKVEFSSEAGKELNLRMQIDMHQLPDDYGVAKIESVAPRWQPGQATYELGEMPLYKQFDGELQKQMAWQLLSELEKGRYPTFYYQDWYQPKDTVAVALSSVNFRSAYDAFRGCINALLPFSFKDIAYTVLSHENDSEKLTNASQSKLEQISQYLAVDDELELVLVNAYTDALGARGPNQELSEKRAQEIKDFFVERGIDENRIETVGHGEDRPVAGNANELDRAKNRRVVVRLSKPSGFQL
ncbi:MAG: flagellar protein MotY [Pseudomonadota bacterium]